MRSLPTHMGRSIPLMIERKICMPQRRFLSEKIKQGFTPRIQTFIENALSISSAEKQQAISRASCKLKEFYALRIEEKKACLQNYVSDDLSTKNTAIYHMEGSSIPLSSAVWYLGLGKDPFYPAPPSNCNIEILSSEIEKLSQSGDPILIEERGAFHGGNLFELIIKLNQKQNAFGLGADINLPNLSVGIAMNKYLGLEKLVQIGFGGGYGISKLDFAGIKAVTMLNLMSVLSPEQASKVIDCSCRSLKSNDLIVVQTMDCTESNIQQNTKDGNWVKTNVDGLVAFRQDYEYSVAKLEEFARSREKLFPSDWEFELGSFDAPVEKTSKILQHLTFYEKFALISLLEKAGFIPESVKDSADADGMKRLIIVARKK